MDDNPKEAATESMRRMPHADEDVEKIAWLEAENERLRPAVKEAQEAIETYSASGPGSIDFDAILAWLRAALRRHN